VPVVLYASRWGSSYLQHERMESKGTGIAPCVSWMMPNLRSSESEE
jgi:hypothetical protein